MATITLSADTFAEDTGDGTLIGTLGVAGGADGETFSYTLADSFDDRFEIRREDGVYGLYVKTANFDYETIKQYVLNIQAVGSQGTIVEPSVTVAVANVNEAPTDIEVTGGTIRDDEILGATVATLVGKDPDKGDLLTYTIVTDATGSTVRNHPYFEINGNEIVVKSDLANAQNSSSIYVKVTDAKGEFFVKQVTLNVTHVIERPDVTFEAKDILEGSNGSQDEIVVGTLKASSTVTYMLSEVSAAYFTLVENADHSYKVVLNPGVVIDLTNDELQILQVTVKDSNNNEFYDTFDLNILEDLEPEPNFQFNMIPRNAGAETLVGTLEAEDPEGKPVTFTLSAESADLFRLSRNVDGTYHVVVKDGVTLDYDNEDHHSFTVTVSDGFNAFEESFDLEFLNAAPEAEFEASTIDENTQGKIVVGTLFVSDPEEESVQCTLSADSAKLFELVDVEEGIYDVVLKDGIALNYENLAHHTLKMVMTDGSNSVSKTFEIDLADVNEKPTITPTPRQVSEGAGGGTVVGTLTATDPEGDAISYTLTPESAQWFDIFENEDGSCDIVVRDGVQLDYENSAHYSVTVLASDGENTVTTSVAISIVNGIDVLIGTQKKDALTGTAGRDIIRGLNGNDRLSAGDGDDKLYGGLGKDTLEGGGGQDIFVFDTKLNKKTNLDKITDFSVSDDSIWLENKIFKKLGKKGSETAPAQLNKKFFALEKAKDKDDYIVYSKKTGKLSYDADGSGSKAAVEIATLTKKLAMTSKDFFVI